MQTERKTQLKIVTTHDQVEGLEQVARERGVSKQAVVRDAIAAVTGVPNEFHPYPGHPGRNAFAEHNARRIQEAAARRKREEASS